MVDAWQDKLKQYCEKYHIPILFLADVLYEPKVLPMIRGKAFEYSVMAKLQEILPTNEWKVSKATPAEELSFHDTDIRVFHKRTGKTLRIECKLTKKQGYHLYPDGHSEIRVKCMRSRTLGAVKVKELAPKLGVDEKVLSIHNDQYLAADFDIVVTSIANAFYRTEKGLYEWKPTEAEKQFLTKLGPEGKESLEDFAFRTIYIARTANLAAKSGTGVHCTRAKCKNKGNCGFIPNYPIIRFDAKTNKPTNKWVPIEDSPVFFKNFIIS